MIVSGSSDNERGTALDLFSGAGGFSLGFKKLGFRPLVAIESDPHAAQTYGRNNSETLVINTDIKDIRTDDLHRCVRNSGKELDVIVAGLPCQGFSESNRRSRNLSNPLNSLYWEFLRILDGLRPKWFVFENVAGIRTLAGGAVLDELIARATQLGYRSDWAELKSEEYGVPQRRRRVFVLGNRIDRAITFPSRTHGNGGAPFITVRDAIGDLPRLENGAAEDYLPYPRSNEITSFQSQMRAANQLGECIQGNLVSRNSELVVHRYRYIKPGENWESIPEELMSNYRDRNRCHTGIYYRLPWDEPAKVIGNFRKNMLIHPEQDRGLSIREAARIQSFHDGYHFTGSIGFQQQQVANAVPPLLAESVARLLAES